MSDFGAVLGFIFGIGVLALVVYVPSKLVIGGLRALDRRAEEKNASRLAAEHRRATPRYERSFLKACTHCQAWCLTLPFRDSLGRTYCSEACSRWLGEGPTSFCHKCALETTPENTGNLERINGTGKGFVGSSDPCSECRSVVRSVFFIFLYIPLIPLGRYRVIHAGPREFLSRKLRG